MVYCNGMNVRIQNSCNRIKAINKIVRENGGHTRNVPNYVNELESIANDEKLDFKAILDSAVKELKGCY